MAQPQWKRLRTDNMKQESSEEVYHEQPSEEEEIARAEIVQKQLQRRAARQLLKLILAESRIKYKEPEKLELPIGEYRKIGMGGE